MKSLESENIIFNKLIQVIVILPYYIIIFRHILPNDVIALALVRVSAMYGLSSHGHALDSVNKLN